MKRSFYLIILLVLFSTGIVSATEAIVNLTKSTNSNPTGPIRAPFHCPVTVTMYDTYLMFNFSNSVGLVTITIKDQTGTIVSEYITDTDIDLEMYIPLDDMSGGNYTLNVQYGTTTLTGSFTIL